MPNLPINAHRNAPFADTHLKRRFYDWKQQEELEEGKFTDTIPMDTPLDKGLDPVPDEVLITQPKNISLDLGGDEPEVSSDPFDQPLDLSQSAESIYSDTKYAALKAEKFNFALGQDSPGEENLRAALELGEDQPIREATAAKVSLQKQEDKIRAIRDKLSQVDRPLTAEEIDEVFFMSKVGTYTDPATVLEEKYGKEYVSTVSELPTAGKVIKQGVVDNHDQVLDSLDYIADDVAKREIVSDLYKDYEQRYKDKSTLGVAWDYAETMVPLKSYGNLSNPEGAPKENIGNRGENRRAAYEYYRTLSPSQFKKEFTAAYNEIVERNIVDAEAFLSGYQDYSPADAALDQVFGYMDWAGVGGLALGSAKLIQGLGNKGLARLGRPKAPRVPMSPKAAPGAPDVPPSPARDPSANAFKDVTNRPDETIAVVPTAEPDVTLKVDPQAGTITVNAENIKAQWDKKPWRSPKVKGVDPLPDDQFLTPDDWYDFTVERQKVKKFLDRKAYETRADYENFLNTATLESIRSGKKNQEVKRVLKETVKASQHPKVEDQLAQVGETDLAAAVMAHKRMKEHFEGLDPHGDALDLQNRTFSLFYPHEHGSNPGSLSVKQADAITAKGLRSAEKLLRATTNNVNVVRMTPEATQAAIETAKAQVVRQYDRLADAVLDLDLGGPFRVYSPEEQAVNVYSLEYRLGRITKKEAAPKEPTNLYLPKKEKPTPPAPPRTPDPTGDVHLDTVNKHTALNGKILVRDLYDRMKTEGSFSGSLADFRSQVIKWHKEGRISTSLHEATLPRPSPVKPPKKLVTTPPTPVEPTDGPMDRLADAVVPKRSYYDRAELQARLKSDLEKVKEEVPNTRQDGKYNTYSEPDPSEDEFYLPTRSDAYIIADQVNHNTVNAIDFSFGGILDMAYEIKAKKGRVTEGQIQKILDYAAGNRDLSPSVGSSVDPKERPKLEKQLDELTRRVGLYHDTMLRDIERAKLTDKEMGQLGAIEQRIKDIRAGVAKENPYAAKLNKLFGIEKKVREARAQRLEGKKHYIEEMAETRRKSFEYMAGLAKRSLDEVDEVRKKLEQLDRPALPAPSRELREAPPAAQLEEGNWASEYRRDIGYGNETLRNRIIDSEVVFKKETKYTSARRFHYIEPPKGFPVKTEAPKVAPTVRASFTPAAPGNISALGDSLTDLLSKLGKTPNRKLKERIEKAIAAVEKRVTTRGLGEDIRGPGEAMNTSPYAEVYTNVTRRKIDAPSKLEKAYLDLSGGNYSRRVRISDLRKKFPKMSKEEFDKQLLKKQSDGDIVLYTLDDPTQLTKADKDGAIDILGNKRHLVYIEQGKKRQIDQIEVSDVDRRLVPNRSLSSNEKERFAALEKEVHQYLASVKRPTRTPIEEPYVIEKKMGKRGAVLFDSEAQAANYGVNLYGLSPKQFKIKPQGGKYYISIPKVVEEVVPQARDLMTTTSNKSAEGFLNAFIGAVRTPDEMLSEMANANRKIAAYAPSELHRLMQEAAQEIRKLPRSEREELIEIWEANRDILIEEGEDGEKVFRGKFYDTYGDFERGFSARHDKLPTEGQVAAYFEYVRLYDFDYVLRNLALHRDMGRLGLEKTRLFTHIDNDGQIDSIASRWFSARDADELPLGDPSGENWGVYVYDEQAKSGQFHLRTQLTKDVTDDIDNKVKNHGYKILELGNPLEKPLRKLANTDEFINFMVVKNFEKVKYDWAILPKRPGGHVDYGDKWFTKQPKIRRSDTTGLNRHIYEGDTALLNHSSEAEAKQLSNALDTARQMKMKGDPGLEDFLDRNTPVDKKTFDSWFEPRTLKNGEEIPPKLNINDPITYTFSGRNTFDMDHFKLTANNYDNFVDGIRSKYNIFANGVDKKYLGQRDPDLPAVDIGDGETPLMTLTKPRLIDPLDTINSSLANVIRSKYLNDYKHFSVESFIQEYADVMKTPIEEMRRNPNHYLHNPEWDTEVTGEGFYKLQAGKNARRAILNFLGTDSPLGENMHWMQQKLVNSIYENYGQGSANKVVSKKLLPFEKDPATFARSVAFHEHLGLFNIKQLWLQAQSWVNVAGIEGMGAALKAIPRAGIARYVNFKGGDPEFARGLAKLFGIDHDAFMDSYNELRKTGFDNVGGEYASRDDYFDPKVVTGPVGTFLEWGTFFFREGEKFSRLSAWFTAFDKWRAANPTKVMTNSDRLLVLNRADTLTANMSRASNAHIQHGLGSIPTQYYAYQTRLSELMLGKRLTVAEKTRLFATYSAMYGIPVGLSSALIYPFYDGFRQAAIERGYNMDDKTIQLFHDGLISTATTLITGEQYDISQKYGPSGLNVFKDIKGLLGFGETDKTLLDIIIGASGQTLKDNVKALGTGAEYIGSLFTVEQDGPTMADLVDVTKNVGSVGSGIRAWYMHNTGRFMTKNEGVVKDDLSSFDAFMHGIFGVTPNEVGDTFRMAQSRKEQRSYEDVAKKQVIKYMRQSMRYLKEGDDQNSKIALRKAKAHLMAGGIRPDQYSQIIKEAYKGNESMFESIQRDFIQKAPLDQMKDRTDAAIEHKRRNTTKGF